MSPRLQPEAVSSADRLWALRCLRLLLRFRVLDSTAALPEAFAELGKGALTARVAALLECPRGFAERAALAETAASLFFAFPNESFNDAETLRDCFLELLGDWRYDVRRRMAGLFPSVLTLWSELEEQESVLRFAAYKAVECTQLAGCERAPGASSAGKVFSMSWARLLPLLFDDPDAADTSQAKLAAAVDDSGYKPEEDETAILLLGELAARSPALEAKAVHALCRLATHSAELLAAAAAVLDDVAQQLGYASRQAYLYSLAPAIAHRWIATRSGVAELLGAAGPERALWQEELGSVARAVAVTAEARLNANVLYLDYAEYVLAPLLRQGNSEAIRLFAGTIAAAQASLARPKARARWQRSAAQGTDRTGFRCCVLLRRQPRLLAPRPPLRGFAPISSTQKFPADFSGYGLASLLLENAALADGVARPPAGSLEALFGQEGVLLFQVWNRNQILLFVFVSTLLQ